MPQEKLVHILAEDILEGARRLVGAVLVRGNRRARIVETEAYRASYDPASHAYRGQTARNATMFGPPGFAYVYLNYGLHWMLNVSALDEGVAAAVLIRAAEPLSGFDEFRQRRGAVKDDELLRGPGKLGQAFDLTRADDGLNLLDPTSPLHILPGEPVPLIAGPRIGISVGQELPWRFADASRLAWVSRPVPPRWR